MLLVLRAAAAHNVWRSGDVEARCMRFGVGARAHPAVRTVKRGRHDAVQGPRARHVRSRTAAFAPLFPLVQLSLARGVLCAAVRTFGQRAVQRERHNRVRSGHALCEKIVHRKLCGLLIYVNKCALSTSKQGCARRATVMHLRCRFPNCCPRRANCNLTHHRRLPRRRCTHCPHRCARCRHRQ